MKITDEAVQAAVVAMNTNNLVAYDSLIAQQEAKARSILTAALSYLHPVDVPELVRYARVQWDELTAPNGMIEHNHGKYVLHSQAAATLAAKDVEIERLNEEVVKNGEDEDKEQWLYWRRRYKKAAQKISNQKGELYSRYKNNERLLKRAEAAEAKLPQIKAQVPVAWLVDDGVMCSMPSGWEAKYAKPLYADPIDQNAEIERLREALCEVHAMIEHDRSGRFKPAQAIINSALSENWQS